MVRSVLAVLAVLAVVLIVSLAAAGKKSGHGCIYLTIPAATGAQDVYQCGATARSTCQSTAVAGAFSPQAARSVATECRKAGIAISP